MPLHRPGLPRAVRFRAALIGASVLLLVGVLPAAAGPALPFAWHGTTQAPPTRNTLTAGGVVKVRFSLGGDQGLSVLSSGWPKSQRFDCSTGALVPGTRASTVSDGTGLVFNAATGVYAYSWQTDETWSDTCRRFDLRLTDGSTHSATFRITMFHLGDSVARPPASNEVVAGERVKVGFRMGGGLGRSILAAGYPRSAPADCETGAVTGAWSPTTPEGLAGLWHAAPTQEYRYGWLTRTDWDRTCRRFELRLTDGTVHALAFRFGHDNHAPVVETTWADVDEHAPIGTVVSGPPAFTDADPGDDHTYAVRTFGGPEAVEIHPTTGVITVIRPWLLDYHEGEPFTTRGVAIEVIDDGWPSKTGVGSYKLRIRDVAEAPVVAPASFSIAEDVAIGTSVGTPVVVTEPTGDDAVTFSITAGNDEGAFAIDAATGQISVADAAALDHETRPLVELTVTATEQSDAALTGSATVTIEVTDVETGAVPVGGTQNYLGVGFFNGATSTTTPGSTTYPADNERRSASSTPSGTWTSPANAYSTGVTNSTTINNAQQQWGTFNLQTYVPNDATLVVDGIQVRLSTVDLQGSGTDSVCQLRTQLSWDAGTSWSTTQTSSNLSTSAINVDIPTTTTNTWGHRWTHADFSNTNFRVRLIWLNGPLTDSPCPSTRSVDVDDLDVHVYWHTTLVTPPVTTTTCCTLKDVVSPYGQVLAPQNFWTAMQSQGTPSVQGDAYMTKYQTRTGTLNEEYDPAAYYNYGVQIPAGASNGEVWIFDPGFCDVTTANGTGENWTVGGANGYTPIQPVSAFYEVYDTLGTPYDLGDDLRVDPLGDDTAYRRLSFRDSQLNGNTSAAADCVGLAWHNGWWQLASGLAGGTTYRVHTHSHDNSSPTDQDNTTALNAFSIYATATAGTPKVYGMGAMEAYVRLPGNTSSEFYLAKVDARHAGEQLVIELWDPGDTGSLTASLSILAPGSTSYTATAFDWTSARGTANPQASTCDGLSGTNVTSVITNSGGSSRFNGCWLTITIPIGATYSAPHPSSDTVTTDGGWWKVRYAMGGSSSSYSTDLSTWKASIDD